MSPWGTQLICVKFEKLWARLQKQTYCTYCTLHLDSLETVCHSMLQPLKMIYTQWPLYWVHLQHLMHSIQELYCIGEPNKVAKIVNRAITILDRKQIRFAKVKYAKYSLVPASPVYCFSLFYIIMNWIYLCFGLLVRQSRTFEDIRVMRWGFFFTIFWLFKNQQLINQENNWKINQW